MADPVTYEALSWDDTGDRLYETGVDRGVLYPVDSNGEYSHGYAWNGLTAVTETPSGAEANNIYADNIKYLELRSVEEYGGTIEAYTYPDEFMACDGTDISTVTGVRVGQQKRKPFGLCYRTKIGSDADPSGDAYLLHIIYNATASPSEKAYETINDSPDAITLSWEFTTNSVPVVGAGVTNPYEALKPVSSIVIDSRTVNASKLADLEEALYGAGNVDGTTDPQLPTPGEVLDMLKTN